MPTCKYTGIEFIRRKDQPLWTREHPTIKDARAALLSRHEGRYQSLYMSAVDQVLDAAAPFTLADVDRLMDRAESTAAEQEREHRKVDLPNEEAEELNRKHEAIYGHRHPEDYE